MAKKKKPDVCDFCSGPLVDNNCPRCMSGKQIFEAYSFGYGRPKFPQIETIKNCTMELNYTHGTVQVYSGKHMRVRITGATAVQLRKEMIELRVEGGPGERRR